MVHGELNPSNICLDEKGNTIICHFDNAVAYNDDGTVALSANKRELVPTSQSGDQLTDSDKNSLSNTCSASSCVSPESILGQSRPGKSDVFSIGVIAYKLMTSVSENPWGIDFVNDGGAQLLYFIH